MPVGLLVLGMAALSQLPRLKDVPAANPPGNNGTVKVDGLPFDDHPDNEPHPGCAFQIDFYGFDAGDLFANVLFETIPPTGNNQQLLTDTVSVGEDDNSGGGSEAGLDASQTYDLTAALLAIDAHPIQGYHVKLTVHADGAQGADTKFKVFWVGPCQPPATCPPTATPVPTPSASALNPNPTMTLPPTDTDPMYLLFRVDPCVPGPPPVIPESPLAVVLPLSALALFGALLWRRRGRPAAATDEGRDAY